MQPTNAHFIASCYSIYGFCAENVRTESQIIAQAGLPGTVTIATNMAGRGTDIILGGNPEGLTKLGLMRLILRQGTLSNLRVYCLRSCPAGGGG